MWDYQYAGSPFYNNESIKQVIIEDGVTSIGKNAFEYSGLMSVSIPKSVTSIGIFAFSDCDSLTSAIIYAKTISIDWDAFAFSSPIFYTYPDSDAYQWAKDKGYEVKEITGPAKLNKSALKLKVGASGVLTVRNLMGRTVTWASSDTAVATVFDGKVTAKKKGTCKVTATLSDGTKLTCKATVVKP